MRHPIPYQFAALAASGLISCISSSCVAVSHTRFKDEPRQSVRFSSGTAAQTFYDAYISINAARVTDGKLNKFEAKSGVLPPYWMHSVPTENVQFNAAVKEADLNHNNNITEKEARAYAGKVAIERDKKVFSYRTFEI
jgi:hypothetical protein